jgi:hypothetical protein
VGVGAGVGVAAGVGAGVGDAGPLLEEHAAIARIATQTQISIPHLMVLVDMLSPPKIYRITNGFTCDDSAN